MVHALKMLSIRPRTCYEIRSRLEAICARRKSSLRAKTAADYTDVDCAAVAQATVDELVADGRLNDEAYAMWHASQRALNRPRSRIVLRSELVRRGVDPSIAHYQSATVDELPLACALATKKGALSDEAFFKFLLRRGFPVRVAQGAVQERRARAVPPEGT
jgi:SOS response regulatory protein OraA/RecX